MNQELNTNDIVNTAFLLTEEFVDSLEELFYSEHKPDILQQARLNTFPVLASYLGRDRAVEDISLFKSVFQKMHHQDPTWTSMNSIHQSLDCFVDEFLDSNRGSHFIGQLNFENFKMDNYIKDEIREKLKWSVKRYFKEGAITDPKLMRAHLSSETDKQNLTLFKPTTLHIAQQLNHNDLLTAWHEHLLKLVERSEQYLQTMDASLSTGFQLPSVNGSTVLAHRQQNVNHVDIESTPSTQAVAHHRALRAT